MQRHGLTSWMSQPLLIACRLTCQQRPKLHSKRSWLKHSPMLHPGRSQGPMGNNSSFGIVSANTNNWASAKILLEDGQVDGQLVVLQETRLVEQAAIDQAHSWAAKHGWQSHFLPGISTGAHALSTSAGLGILGPKHITIEPMS
eukprot:1750217-Prorocentrum_lima.AAC.1